jgi:hypothetical protein
MLKKEIDEKLKQIERQKNYMFYVLFLLEKYKAKRQKERIVKVGKNKRKYFAMPTILERFFYIEFNKFIQLSDEYFLENNEKISIQDYLYSKKNYSIPLERISLRMFRIVTKEYKYVYEIFNYFKINNNINITDSFLYLVYLYTDVPHTLFMLYTNTF